MKKKKRVEEDMTKPPLTRAIAKRIAKRMKKNPDRDIIVLLEMCCWYEEQLIFSMLKRRKT